MRKKMEPLLFLYIKMDKKYYISWDIGIKNLAFAILSNNELIYWKKMAITNKKKITKNEIAKCLFDTLEKNKKKILIHNYEIAIIESQVKKNVKAGWLFSSLSMWLFMNGIKKIIPVTAMKKFSSLKIEMPKKYTERKKIIIKKCEETLNDASGKYIISDICKKKMLKYKKKDDISDAFIMGYCYIKDNFSVN
jgi:hypothetical protein